MFHEIEDIEQERLRVARRPPPQDAPPVLSTFDVTLTVPAAEYEARLRSVLDAALGIALSADFAEEDLPVAAVPAWFAEVSGPLSARAPRFARRGRERYAAAIRGGRCGSGPTPGASPSSPATNCAGWPTCRAPRT
ncbi:hypothetical protein [Streptomyces formicae]|uniref:hypothetical protein n=1 Tax=Streptomyces formicae TaxID=1616117 RepID=UPI0018FE4F32|nr:hypothetical protein [Streptomyces formicae]